MRKSPASACSVVYLKPTLDCAVQTFSLAKVPEIRVCLELQGTLHAVCLDSAYQHVQRACALPIDDKW